MPNGIVIPDGMCSFIRLHYNLFFKTQEGSRFYYQTKISDYLQS